MRNINEQEVNLPNGKYDTLWSGGKMKIMTPEKDSVTIDTNILVKGINCKTKIEIEDGDVYPLH